MGSDAFPKQRKTTSWGPLAASFVSGFLLAALLLRQSPTNATNSTNRLDHASTPPSGCQISLGTYQGPTYTTTETVGTPVCLVESKFLKLQQHAVRIAASDNDATVIPDWLFVDYHDQINVLVEAPKSKSATGSANHTEPEFFIFEQTKYALEGRTSKAVVGGLVEPGEDADETAQREVREEMHLQCREWVHLGRYRADVNRGAGWTSCYLARNCHSSNMDDNETDETADQVGARDAEQQELQRITLSDLIEHVMDGAFLEIKWSATVALGLLHYYYG